MERTITVGLSVLAGVALLETALIPGMLIGAAAVLAPKYLPLPWRPNPTSDKRRPQPAAPQKALAKTQKPAALIKVEDMGPKPSSALSVIDLKPAENETSKIQGPVPQSSLAARQALVKTITFRGIVTTLDFGANYIVIGELATAAGLSAFSLAVGPFFYFVHEIAWNKFGAPEAEGNLSASASAPSEVRNALLGLERLTKNKAVAKTITYRTFATTMDFTVNYIAVGDAITAAGLSAFGFLIGPFVYLGHEMAWDRYGWLRQPAPIAAV